MKIKNAGMNRMPTINHAFVRQYEAEVREAFAQMEAIRYIFWLGRDAEAMAMALREAKEKARRNSEKNSAQPGTHCPHLAE